MCIGLRPRGAGEQSSGQSDQGVAELKANLAWTGHAGGNLAGADLARADLAEEQTLQGHTSYGQAMQNKSYRNSRRAMRINAKYDPDVWDLDKE